MHNNLYLECKYNEKWVCENNLRLNFICITGLLRILWIKSKFVNYPKIASFSLTCPLLMIPPSKFIMNTFWLYLELVVLLLNAVFSRGEYLFFGQTCLECLRGGRTASAITKLQVLFSRPKISFYLSYRNATACDHFRDNILVKRTPSYVLVETFNKHIRSVLSWNYCANTVWILI